MWNVNKEQIENIMMSSMKRSDRYRSLKNAGLSKEQILAEFKKPVAMTVYSLRGDIDTTMTPGTVYAITKALHTGFTSIEPTK
ncbi:MAG: hypothetical protein IPH32_16160 [Bacteroidetes bacterium]|nr:hypothetical protein [Bacteroidota bacterium]